MRERYVDENGQLKEAIAYGTEERDLLVWYDIDAVR